MTTEIRGATTIAAVRSLPWYNVATRVDEAMTSEEAIVKAGLDWNVSLRDVYVPKFDGDVYPHGWYRQIKAENYRATVRDDTNTILGIMSPRYKVFQNRKTFGFCDELLEGARFDAAGSFNGGRTLFLLMKLPDTLKVNGDEMYKYLLASTSHDGTRALTVAMIAVRLSCHNMMASALSRASRKLKVRHTMSLDESVGKARSILGLSADYFAELEEQSQRLLDTPVDDKAAVRLTRELFGVPYDAMYAAISEDKWTGKMFGPGRTLTLFKSGAGNSGETAWDWYNGVTEYLTHEARVRGAGNNTIQQEEKRLVKNIFTDGANMRQKAWDMATNYAIGN